MTTGIRRLLLAAAFLSVATAAGAQTLSPLTQPAAGAQTFTYSCSVAGCATGTVVGTFAPTQGNALLSATNPSFMSLVIAGAVNAVGNPLFFSPGTGAVFTSNLTELAGSTLAAPTAPGTPQTTGLVSTVNVANTNPSVANNATLADSATANNSPVVNFNYGLNGSTWTPAASDVNGNYSVTPYPANAVPITASATGTTAATTATLTNVTGHKTYICGYSIRANATAATTVLDTVTGVVTATMSSELWVAPAASGLGVDEQIFTPCIPASAVSTSIAVVSGAPGTGGLVSVKAWGYSL
jgi:hypothetical protein